MTSMPTVVSFSDGEGTYSVAYVVYYPRVRHGRPAAAQGVVPEELRSLHLQRKNDITNNEAYGPLGVLMGHGEDMEICFWLHFIDNESALHSMVRGSASVEETDNIVGATWSLIARHRIIPYFEGVDSASNPIDGLARGIDDDLETDWLRIPFTWPGLDEMSTSCWS